MGISSNHSALEYLRQSDAVLAKIMERGIVPNWESTHNVFHDLVSCIVEQQIHYRSSKKIFAKALERAGINQLMPANFDTFEQFGLAPLALSEAKYATLLAVVEFWRTHSLSFETMSDAEVRATLLTIKGIGPWTIDMILLFTLQRPHVVPYDDYHLKQIMIGHYALNPKVKLKAQMQAVAEFWGDYSSLAVLYLLASKQFSKLK